MSRQIKLFCEKHEIDLTLEGAKRSGQCRLCVNETQRLRRRRDPDREKTHRRKAVLSGWGRRYYAKNIEKQRKESLERYYRRNYGEYADIKQLQVELNKEIRNGQEN